MKKCLLFLATCLPFLVLGQRDLSAGLHFGFSDYYGDLTLPDIGSSKEFNVGLGLYANKSLTEAWALNAQFLYLKLSGADANFEERTARDFSFDNQLIEISLSAEWYLLADKKWSPYLTGGIALGLGNPEPVFSPEKLENFPKTQEDINADYSNANFVLPLGIGLRYQIHDNWTLKLQAVSRVAFSDYLDGISQAGNPEKNDWYSFTGISIGRRFASTDSDKDGVADKDDNCPQIPGDKALAGCPDSDKDGVLDHLDNCPQEAGTVNGCPDRDRDGIVDFLDQCPDEAGRADRQGCPVLVKDSDGDGIADEKDNCPQEAGLISRKGCPLKDQDGDGVEDALDNCPNEAGLASNKGCPAKEEPSVEKEEMLSPDWTIQQLYYETDNGALEAEHNLILQKVVATLQAWPKYHLTITGHTDDAGDVAYNQALSAERAKNCYQYLLDNGIPASRITYVGAGETQPTVPNTTEENRRLNRRTVLELKLK